MTGTEKKTKYITCARCGADVFTTGPRTKYCLACATQIRLENQNKRRSGKGKLDPAHTKHITCVICGKDVVVSSKATHAKYCPECSAKALKTSKGKYRDKEANTITCVRCGAEVVVKDRRAHNRMYCDDCQKVVYAELRKKAKIAFNERKRTAVGLQGNQKRCARCGVIFEAQGSKKYCDDCRRFARNEAQRNSREKHKETRTGICTRCGKEFEFVFRGSERALCDDCRYKLGGRPKSEPKKRKKKKGPTLKEIERAANEKGISYGKYKAIEYMKKLKGAKKND